MESVKPRFGHVSRAADLCERGHVSQGEVLHVHIVPAARAVPRVEVVPEDGEAVPQPHRHLRHEGEEVAGRATRVLAQLRTGVRPGRVEVPRGSFQKCAIYLVVI